MHYAANLGRARVFIMDRADLIARLLGTCALALCPGCQSDAGGPSLFAAGPNSPIAVGPNPSAPAIADFNGDAKPDIVLACGTRADPETGGILLLLNDGAARFTHSPGGRIDVGIAVTELAVADFDGDRHTDVAAMSHDSYQVHLYLGDGKGGLGKAPDSPFPAYEGEHPHTHACIAADVNRDGHPDLLTSNADDNAIAVLLNDGNARFTPAPGSPFAALGHPYSSLAVNDFNADGKLDVAAPLLESGEIGVYLGDGAGGFAPGPGSPYAVAARPGFVYADDLDGDGDPDLMATHDDVGIVDVLLNEGDGRFRFAPGSPVRLDEQVWSIVTGDFDDDGDRDALLTSLGRSLVLLLGDGRGGFVKTEDAGLATGESPNRLASGHLGSEGRACIVSTNYDSGDVTVLVRR